MLHTDFEKLLSMASSLPSPRLWALLALLLLSASLDAEARKDHMGKANGRESQHARSLQSRASASAAANVSSQAQPWELVGGPPHPNAPADGVFLLQASSNWGSAVPSSWSLSNPCSVWDYIQCDAITGKIIELYNPSEGVFYGTLGASIGLLTDLTYLFFDNSYLHGILPASLSKLVKLQYLSFRSNYLSGSFPPGLGNLAKLTNLQLTKNAFTGFLPSSVGKLTNLMRMRLNENAFCGPIPRTWGGLVSLTQLDLNYNKISGPLPSTLTSLRQLTGLKLNRNRIAGAVPTFFSLFDSSMKQILLRDNLFSGSLPVELASLASTVNLELRFNRITGIIPVEYTGLLGRLDVQNNYLTGAAIEISNLLQDNNYLTEGCAIAAGNCIPDCENSQKDPMLCGYFCGANNTAGPCNGKGTCVPGTLVNPLAKCSCVAGYVNKCYNNICTCVQV